MKKFAKLVAAIAALALAWACFVACSNGDDDSGSNSASVQELQGLWIGEDGWGTYVAGDEFYEALFDKTDKKYYYNKDDATKFSVSGNKFIMYYDEEEDDFEFSIKGDTFTIKYYDEKYEEWQTDTYKKVTEEPTGISDKEFEDLGNKLFSDSEE